MELQFKGKEFVHNHHLTVPFRPLEMHPAKGIGAARLDGNLIVQGDNLPRSRHSCQCMPGGWTACSLTRPTTLAKTTGPTMIALTRQ